MSDSAENPQATPGRKRARTQVSQEASLFASPDALEWAAYGTPPRIRQYGEPESGTVPSTSEIQRQVCEVASIQEGTDEGAAAASAEPIEDEVEEEVPRPQRRRRTNAALTWEIAFCLLKLYTSGKIEQYHDKKNNCMMWKKVVQLAQSMSCLQPYLEWLNTSQNPALTLKNKTQSLYAAITSGTPETMLQFSGRSNADLLPMVPKAQEVLRKHVKQYQILEARAKKQKELFESVQKEWSLVFSQCNCPCVFRRTQTKRLEEWKEEVFRSVNPQEVDVPEQLKVHADLIGKLQAAAANCTTSRMVHQEMERVIKDCGYTLDAQVQEEQDKSTKAFTSVLVEQSLALSREHFDFVKQIEQESMKMCEDGTQYMKSSAQELANMREKMSEMSTELHEMHQTLKNLTGLMQSFLGSAQPPNTTQH